MPEVRQHILIVDDIEENQELLKRRLERKGYAAIVAESGQCALDTIAKGGVDLVLLDIMMPGMSGLETLERLRRDTNRGSLPVIMVSAKSESEDVVKGCGSGMENLSH